MIITPSFEDRFESICDKRSHAGRVLHAIDTMVEEMRLPCWMVQEHMKINKIVQRYQLIVFILNKFGHVRNKISYKINNFNSKFDMNYMSFCLYQMVILITNIQRLSGKLILWAGTCINVKKLDSIFQITSQISKVLQSPCHRALLKDDKKITLHVLF